MAQSSLDNEGLQSDNNISKGENEKTEAPALPYSAFPTQQRRFILGIVTAAGFFGPLSGGIYLPALLLFETIFGASTTAINATVSVYMAVFAIAVSFPITKNLRIAVL